jgi:CBS domain containing-hemolysin-like protein
MVILIFGEVVPKNLGLHYPDQVSKVTAFFIYWISKAIYPVSFTFTKLTQFFINRWGEKSPETALSKYEIKSIIHLSYKRGLLRKEETELIEKIVNFSHMEIQNLMFPRKDLLALSLKEPMSRAWELMEKYGFGKILIYRDNIDHIVGFLHIRDFIKREWEPERPIQSYPYFLRDVHFIPETKGPIEVLKLLRAKKVSFGVVLDEYGGTAGIVTVNQIIKNIIGEYVKESPDKEDQLFITKENELIVNAHSVNLRHVKEWFRLEEEWNNEEETVASYVLRKLDKIPVEGETFQTRFLKWTVLVMKENSISKVGIKRR